MGVTGQKTGEPAKDYAFLDAANAHAPHGAVQQMRLANGYWEHATYNPRFQKQSIGLGTSASDFSISIRNPQSAIDSDTMRGSPCPTR